MARELMALFCSWMISWRRLAEAQKQRQQGHAHVQPRRETHDVDQRHACRHTQHEARRDDQHVDDDDVFEFEGVGQIDQRVQHDDDAKGRIQRERGDEREQPDRDRRAPRDRDRQLAGGDGPVLLLGMLPIGVDIGDVVDDVDRAGDQAQQHKAEDGLAQRRLEEGAGHKELGVEHDGGEDENVFRQPLLGPHGAEEGAEEGAEDGEHEQTIP